MIRFVLGVEWGGILGLLFRNEIAMLISELLPKKLSGTRLREGVVMKMDDGATCEVEEQGEG